jgi:hypothetical protein
VDNYGFRRYIYARAATLWHFGDVEHMLVSMADKPDPKPDDSYSDEEAAKRRDATVRAMIGMRPKPHAPTARGTPRPDRKPCEG